MMSNQVIVLDFGKEPNPLDPVDVFWEQVAIAREQLEYDPCIEPAIDPVVEDFPLADDIVDFWGKLVFWEQAAIARESAIEPVVEPVDFPPF